MREIKSIEDVPRYLPNGYHEVCIEISGYCNAKCKYCPSGSKKQEEIRKMMDVDLFEEVVRKLKEYKIIGKESQIDLFWWGEPFLNPQLKDIIKITQKYDVEYVLSTNAFHYQKLEKKDCKNLKRLIISMPGFSQCSYDKIHQFDFKVILENIRKYVQDLREAGVADKIWVAYHIYQFNLGEIFDCYQFCCDLGISFNPGFAFPLLVKERIGYAKNELPIHRKEEMYKEIVTDQLDRMIQCSDKKSCIYQKRNFIVDEFGGVFSCLNLEHNPENYCGNILKEDMNAILDKIANSNICEECIKCGVAPTDMSFKFFYDDWFQMMKLRSFYEEDMNPIKKAKAKIMLLLRKAEQITDEINTFELFDEVYKIMCSEKICLDDINIIIQKYAMRKNSLQKKFNVFMEAKGEQ